MAWIEHHHADVNALAAAVAAVLDRACAEGIAARGQARLVLAGGRTPLPAYARWASGAPAGPIHAIASDERCVPHAHPACNFAALRTALAAAAGVCVHPITRADGEVAASLALARAWLAAHPQPFDAVLLGMGSDGHIASLFPGAAQLDEGLDPGSAHDAIALRPDPMPPEAPCERITLTLARLLRAREIHLMTSGQNKRQVLEQAQHDPRSALPVARLLHAHGATIHLHWSP